MTAAAALLADLRSRGVELETDGVRLRWRPGFLVTGPLAGLVQACRADLIELLTGPDRLDRCPACRWPLDSARRCPKCFDRLCMGCGRLTASYFIMRCVACGHAFQEKGAGDEPDMAMGPATGTANPQDQGGGRGGADPVPP
jgi:hypothetical protein